VQILKEIKGDEVLCFDGDVEVRILKELDEAWTMAGNGPGKRLRGEWRLSFMANFTTEITHESITKRLTTLERVPGCRKFEGWDFRGDCVAKASPWEGVEPLRLCVLC
jgi:hypothetical protein